MITEVRLNVGVLSSARVQLGYVCALTGAATQQIFVLVSHFNCSSTHNQYVSHK